MTAESSGLEGKLPTWMPHELPNYDLVLEAACKEELKLLISSDSKSRMDFINDPREVHARIYKELTPPNYPEYAGTYRGTARTSLENRRSGVTREDTGEEQQFAKPDRVAHWMGAMAPLAREIFELPRQTPPEIVFEKIVKQFYLFGLTHPFLDGNGHIQRLMFATFVMERNGLSLKDDWTIHPRPYDIEIKMAFEAGTTEARLAELYKVLQAYVSFDA